MTKQNKNALIFWSGLGVIVGSVYLGRKLFSKKDSNIESKSLKRVKAKNVRENRKDSNIESSFDNLEDSIKDSNKYSNLESFGDYAYTDSIRFSESNTQDYSQEYENLESYSQYPYGKVSLRDTSDQVASNDDNVAYNILENNSARESVISLRFDGELLRLIIHKNGDIETYSFQAVSGKAQSINGKNYFTYEMDRQYLKGEGPIPEGEYFITPLSQNENDSIQYWDDISAWQKLGGYIMLGQWKRGTIGWGKIRIPIQPKIKELIKNGEIIKRDNFFIHGGIEAGSSGCIDLFSGNERFFEILMKYVEIYKNDILANDGKIPLIVKYKNNAKMVCDSSYFTKHCEAIK